APVVIAIQIGAFPRCGPIAAVLQILTEPVAIRANIRVFAREVSIIAMQIVRKQCGRSRERDKSCGGNQTASNSGFHLRTPSTSINANREWLFSKMKGINRAFRQL